MSTGRARFGEEHLGRGWSFPVRWSVPRPAEDGTGPPTGAGAVRMVSGTADVQEAIRVVLGTELGSRIMRPGFGADIARYVFAERRAETCFRLQTDVERALLLWEPRIIVDRVEAVPAPDDQARIDVRIDYRVDRHRRPDSLVYPFYVDERTGTPLPATSPGGEAT